MWHFKNAFHAIQSTTLIPDNCTLNTLFLCKRVQVKIHNLSINSLYMHARNLIHTFVQVPMCWHYCIFSARWTACWNQTFSFSTYIPFRYMHSYIQFVVWNQVHAVHECVINVLIITMLHTQVLQVSHIVMPMFRAETVFISQYSFMYHDIFFFFRGIPNRMYKYMPVVRSHCPKLLSCGQTAETTIEKRLGH